jgi:hypothetical protein
LDFGDGCPVFACHAPEHKATALGFGAQRGGRQSELGGDHAETHRRIIIDGDLDIGGGCF